MVQGLSMNAKETAFRKMVWAYAKKNGRNDLPWRKTHDPYRILVSEIMLQQTQVERVVPYFNAWMKKYPNVKKLAQASLSEVLKSWQGLGYNRRGKNLHLAAKALVENDKGKMPSTVSELEKLPGIGPYTARAVLAFAHNQDVIFIETNIRTVITHHFFPKKEKVEDTEIQKILEKVYPEGKAREWYGALMDYGTYLKRSGVRINAKAKGYKAQAKFSGSDREARGAILKALAKKEFETKTVLLGVLGDYRKEQVETQLSKLLFEGMIEKRGRHFCLPR